MSSTLDQKALSSILDAIDEAAQQLTNQRAEHKRVRTKLLELRKINWAAVDLAKFPAEAT